MYAVLVVVTCSMFSYIIIVFVFVFFYRNEQLALEEGFKLLETFYSQAIPEFLTISLGDTQTELV